jgi:urease accessory protein
VGGAARGAGDLDAAGDFSDRHGVRRLSRVVGVPVPYVEIGIALSGVLLGAAVLTESRPPLWIAAALIAIFAICHGHAHGADLPAGTSGLTYSIGFVAATGLLHACGIGIGTIHRWSYGRLAVRALGGLISVGGVFFLAQAFE